MSISANDVICCNFENWYSKLKKHSIKSICLPLPPEVLSYLHAEGTLVLPSEGPRQAADTASGDAESSDEEDWSDCEAAAAQAPQLGQFSAAVRGAIERLGGAVFPKLNWRAPQDAAWMSTSHSLKCRSPNDVYLLLKSSDRLKRDLWSPFEHCPPSSLTPPTPTLVLKKWREIQPSAEFRLFVKAGRLVGISPRDTTRYHPYLASDRSAIVSSVTSFWRESVENRLGVRDYVLDIARSDRDRVTLLDVSPLHPSTTQPLLFDWGDFEDQLVSEDGAQHDTNSADSNRSAVCSEPEPEFRYIAEETGVQPNGLGNFGLPVELQNMDLAKIMNKLQSQSEREAAESSSSEEE